MLKITADYGQQSSGIMWNADYIVLSNRRYRIPKGIKNKNALEDSFAFNFFRIRELILFIMLLEVAS